MISHDPFALPSSFNFPQQIEQIFFVEPHHKKFVTGQSTSLRSKWSARLQIALFIPFILAGIAVLSFAAYEWTKYVRLATNGVEAEAVVTDHYVNEDSEGDTYYINYEFRTLSEQVVSQRESVSKELYDQLSTGTHVTIHYVSDNPGMSSLSDDKGNDGKRGMVTFFAGFWNLVVAVLIYAFINTARRLDVLAKQGTLVKGQVLEASLQKDSEDETILSMTYQFFSPVGQVISNKLKATRNDLKEQNLPAYQTELAVLYVSDQLYEVL